jgi:hypothetical protein
LPYYVKNAVGEQAEHQQAQTGEYRAEDFASIQFGVPKSSGKAEREQHSTGAKHQKIRPGKVTCNRKEDEEWVTEETGDHEKKSRPYVPVPASFHMCHGLL